MRRHGSPVFAERRAQKWFNGFDLNTNNVTWATNGTDATDILVEGFREFELHVGSDEAWRLGVRILNENDTTSPLLVLFTNIATSPGIIAGDPTWLAFYWNVPPGIVARRIRFRGFGLFVPSPNSHLVVHARA